MYKFLNFTLFVLLVFTNVYGQYKEESTYTGVGLPFFEYTYNRQFSNDYNKSSVYIYAQIVFDDITFVKSDTSGYDAEMEWLVAVYTDDDQLTFSRTITKKINVATFAETNSRTGYMNLKSEVPLDPGEYKFLLRTIDLTTNKTAQRRFDLEIPDYSDKDIALSDLLFLNSIEFDSLGMIKDYQPILSNNFTIKEGMFYLYFNVYSKEIKGQAKIHYKFINNKNKTDFDSTITKPIKSHITSHILKINKNIFTENKYDLEVEVDIDGETEKITKPITFFWKAVPNTLTDIDEALRQMVYILPQDSLSYYLDASLKEKQDFFKRFWKSRDPNPNTKKNELMDEYFKRINYANANFSSLSTNGWLTDRGRILIKFGQPDDIERHPFELESRPYEIWRYYTLRKVFLFEDYTGFGDFRLHPDFLHVEYQ